MKRTKPKKTLPAKRTAVVAAAAAPKVDVIKHLRVPKMDTLPSCRRVLRNILRLVARDELDSKKGWHMANIVNSIAAITRDLRKEEEDAALRAAFEKAIAQGLLSRTAIPAEIFTGTALEGEYLPASDHHPIQ